MTKSHSARGGNFKGTMFSALQQSGAFGAHNAADPGVYRAPAATAATCISIRRWP